MPTPSTPTGDAVSVSPEAPVATVPIAVAPVDAPAPPQEPRIHLHEWADSINHAGRVELVEVYLAAQERLGHVYDTAQSFLAELEAFAKTRV